MIDWLIIILKFEYLTNRLIKYSLIVQVRLEWIHVQMNPGQALHPRFPRREGVLLLNYRGERRVTRQKWADMEASKSSWDQCSDSLYFVESKKAKETL